MSGLLITIEGTEGAGKTTVIPYIKEYLIAHQHEKIECVREPGGTLIAESIRTILKTPTQEKMCDETELLLMYAARAQLVSTFIKPKLKDNFDVICDRHDLSTIAYQGGGRGLSMDIINKIREVALGNFKPNLTLLLDIDPMNGMQRARSRGALDRFEQEQCEFFERVRNTYLECAKKDSSIVVIDAALDYDDVKMQVINALETNLKL